eukprot:TRINITY_DN4759_c0_g1_i19.p2 TRINITY_DN4759_c0_g1~~TRINITY_DN4759_c0_g1_i19.p2  ORF type:complete len:148 (-),score=36.92 TRINITY_DN4759_c0_g1_i19:414-857(-)
MIVNLIAFLKWRLEHCTSYCLFCGGRLIEESFRLSSCNAEFCVFKYEETFGVKLYSEMEANFPLVALNLSVAAKSIYSARALDIFEPFPSFLLKKKENRGRSVFEDKDIKAVRNENKDIHKIRSIMKLFPSLTTLRNNSKGEVSACS